MLFYKVDSCPVNPESQCEALSLGCFSRDGAESQLTDKVKGALVLRLKNLLGSRVCTYFLGLLSIHEFSRKQELETAELNYNLLSGCQYLVSVFNFFLDIQCGLCYCRYTVCSNIPSPQVIFLRLLLKYRDHRLGVPNLTVFKTSPMLLMFLQLGTNILGS